MSVCHYEVGKLGQANCNKRHFEQMGFCSILCGLIGSIALGNAQRLVDQSSARSRYGDLDSTKRDCQVVE
jgi:hypothetical protein